MAMERQRREALQRESAARLREEWERQAMLSTIVRDLEKKV